MQRRLSGRVWAEGTDPAGLGNLPEGCLVSYRVLDLVETMQQTAVKMNCASLAEYPPNLGLSSS